MVAGVVRVASGYADHGDSGGNDDVGEFLLYVAAGHRDDTHPPARMPRPSLFPNLIQPRPQPVRPRLAVFGHGIPIAWLGRRSTVSTRLKNPGSSG